LVKSYGADVIFDYNSPTVAQDIKKLTRNCLKFTLDPFAEIKTLSICHEAMGRAGGRYAALERYQDGILEKKTIKRDLVMGSSIHGKGVPLADGYEKPVSKEQTATGIETYKSVQKVMDQRKLKAHPVRLLDGRFEAVLKGLRMLEKKEVHGEKLVVRL
jgi:hypothetical protein